ncbi:hypothetical protein L207DRAFT_214706 [Hyaloscypha variabilis F]|uniref:Uncharacterized protein n=1 Tax=Hyaloscypha variabilis (strain UAMH 11265 / GT02V1 / F) TaxID=1149755 RepID=A0A2J6S6V9_HYAVF|nr:hypothetical protein L207DRAFT_214706 [Hyaloscypha variabilis F]
MPLRGRRLAVTLLFRSLVPKPKAHAHAATSAEGRCTAASGWDGEKVVCLKSRLRIHTVVPPNTPLHPDCSPFPVSCLVIANTFLILLPLLITCSHLCFARTSSLIVRSSPARTTPIDIPSQHCYPK